jgi:glutathione S-transferase
MYKLFYYPRNASWAPHMVLAEMGVDYELVLVDRKSNAHKSSDYLVLNPTGRIPTLADGNSVIFESAAICLYLCDKHSDKNLMPRLADPNRPKFYQWLFYLNATLQPELMVYFYPNKHTTDQTTIAAIVQAQEQRISDILTLLDVELKNKEFLVGDHISVCDYYLFMLLHWASDFQKTPMSYANLSIFMRTMARRNSVKNVCKVEGTDIAMYS